MTDPLFEETLRVDPLFDGKLLRGERLTVRLPDGREATRELVRHPGAVAVLALLDGGERALFVRQYRAAVERALWEVPAGTLEPDESRLACAQRELVEETGYAADAWNELARFYTAPGFCDEDMTLYRAEGLSRSDAHPRPDDEFLQVRAFTLAEVDALVAEGEVRDAKTQLALALWRLEA